MSTYNCCSDSALPPISDETHSLNQKQIIRLCGFILGSFVLNIEIVSGGYIGWGLIVLTFVAFISHIYYYYTTIWAIYDHLNDPSTLAAISLNTEYSSTVQMPPIEAYPSNSGNDDDTDRPYDDDQYEGSEYANLIQRDALEDQA